MKKGLAWGRLLSEKNIDLFYTRGDSYQYCNLDISRKLKNK